jgi:hypothetical protein
LDIFRFFTEVLGTKLRQAGHVAREGKREMNKGCCWGLSVLKPGRRVFDIEIDRGFGHYEGTL